MPEIRQLPQECVLLRTPNPQGEVRPCCATCGLLSERSGAGDSAVAAVLTLAVGIGTTIGLYTFLRAVMASTSTQIEEVERLARIYASNPAAGAERVQIAPAEFQDVLSHARSFASLGAWASIEVTAKNATTAETLSASAVSPGYFAVLRARPALGRLFSPDDFASG